MNELLNDIENQNQFPKTTDEEGYIYPEDPLVKQNLLSWQNDKFGVLIHLGLYSTLGICESWGLCPEDEEWIPREGFGNYYDYYNYYNNTINLFNPIKFDSEKLAKIIKKSGAKYVIFSSKHHDGFCLFNSKYTDFKVTANNCPYHLSKKPDLLKDFLDACRNEGLKVGIYFSKPDWHSDYFWWKYFPPKDRNPNYNITKHKERWDKFIEFTHNQIKELTSNYGHIDILWLDGCWIRPFNTINERVKEFCNYPYDLDINIEKIAEEARKNQPGLIIVDRWVQGKYENYLTPERKIPDRPLSVPWESCITMGNAWGYVPNDIYKSSEEIISLFIDIIVKGGNLLLGFGPDGNGELNFKIYENLEEIGSWIEKNSEAIYGSTPYPPFKEGNMAYVTNNNSIYIFYLNNKNSNQKIDQITIKLNTSKLYKVRILNYQSEINYKHYGNSYNIFVDNNLREFINKNKIITFKFF